ncbi:MAG: hypothetical protein IJ529_00235 [Alphaproteobacteria bacterium]|nr:hypothetical protein [Alphaproteobacteria bacterium]MBQ9235135.1 hypothetical protein [Alphaproteobacteria bacterium]
MKHLVSLCCALLMLVACSKQPDNNIEAHKAAMKRFETMINTADSNLERNENELTSEIAFVTKRTIFNIRG